MAITKTKWAWLTAIALLVVIIVSVTFIWFGYPRSQPIEITLPPRVEISGQVSISGAISNPGTYPLKAGDSLDNVIKAAGGLTGDAELARLKIHVPRYGEERQPQKIDINRAESWLLELLPGIGNLKAQAIMDYRTKNGPFRNTYELTKVAGIGDAIYDKIKNLIAVSD